MLLSSIQALVKVLLDKTKLTVFLLGYLNSNNQIAID